VEFTLTKDESGKVRAANVTGPMGAYVQGTPRRSFPSNDYHGNERSKY
jgi:hypothetical protein